MAANLTGVARITTAGSEIALVELECFGHGERSVAGIVAGAARGLACRVDRLPEGQDVGAIGRLEIVGKAEALDPVRAGGGAVDVPGAAALVAAIAEPDVRRDRDPVGFLAHRETTASGSGFELGGARFGHGVCARECPKERGTVPQSSTEHNGDIACGLNRLAGVQWSRV